MKIFLPLFFVLFCFASYAQDIKKEKKTQPEFQYCCVKKDYCGEKARRCPNDQMPLIKQNAYYCTKCYKSKKSPGTCGRCDVVLVKMENKQEIIK